MVMRFVALRLTSVFMALCAVMALIFGMVNADVATVSLSVFIIWGAAVAAACSRKRINVIYLFFLMTFFIFLLSRVMVRWINEGEIYRPFSTNVMLHTYLCLFISIVGLWFGSIIKIRFIFGKRNRHKRVKYFDPLENYINMNLLRQISGVATVVTGFATLLSNIEKIAYFRVGMVGALRTDFNSSLPSVILRLSYVYILMLCIYLATMPKKKGALLIFAQYLIITGTRMLYGSRSDFVLGLMFTVVYFNMRDNFSGERDIAGIERWFGKKEKLFCIVAVPALIILVVFVGYFRKGTAFEFTGLIDTIMEFFESQGTSIQVIGNSYIYADEMRQPHFLYLFDNTWTFLKTNPISSFLFNTSTYGGNTVERALYGTSLEYTLYYIVNPQSYLLGYGGGGSYVAEAYLGYGYTGLFFINAILSAVLEKMYKFKYRSFVGFVVSLVFIQQLFFMPRAGFDEFLGDITSLTHIIFIFGIWVVYNMFNNRIRNKKNI